MTPQITEKKHLKAFRGGAITGKIYNTWPFATLSVNEDGLIVNTPTGTFHFSANNLTEVTIEKHLLLRIPMGIRIRHTQNDYPEKIIFWYIMPNKILNQLDATSMKKFVKRN